MDGWVTVHLGPVWQVELYQGLLAENGIEVFLPDATTKVMDPFATGALPMDAQLQVREEDVQRAMQVLAEVGEDDGDVDLAAIALATPPDPSLGLTVEEAAAQEEATALGSVRALAQEALERLATRTRWAALLGITFPWAIYNGFRYLGVVRRRGLRATKHRLTLAALGLALLEPIGAVVIWILVKQADPPTYEYY